MLIKVINQTQNTVLAEYAQVAQTFTTRAKGLLGKKYLQEGSGLLIKPCKQIHSIGMKFNLDAVFIAKDNTVCHLHHDMKPGHISAYINQALYVLEMPAGRIQESGTCVGDVIEFIEMPKLENKEG